MSKNKRRGFPGNENKVKKILQLLDEHYPENTKCYLNYDTPWQLLIATILSAQCTDDRVNLVTKDLFKNILPYLILQMQI